MTRTRRLVRYGLVVAALLGLLGVASVAAVYLYVAPSLPAVTVLKDIQLQVPLRVYTRDGKLLAVYGDKLRIPLDYAQTPPLLSEAFIAAEDDRFFDHSGVDVRSMGRAAINLVLTGQKSQGASTITMQLARNFFLTRRKLFIRKIREVFLALRIDRELTKEDILRLYLNKIYLGEHAYGIGAAAQVYYGKDVWQLDLAQMAMIAGLPKAPSTFNPVVNPKRALERRAYVLGRMHDLGFINTDAYRRAMAAPVTARLHAAQVTVNAPYVGEMVRSYMVDRYGDAAYSAGYRVTTTIDSRLERAAHAAMTADLEHLDRVQGWRGPAGHVDLPADADARTLQAAVENLHPVANLVPGVVSASAARSVNVFLQGNGAVRIDWQGLQWAAGNASRADALLHRGDIVYAVHEKSGWQLAQNPAVEGALVALDPYDGAIVALDGGFDFTKSKFNRAIQAHRQLGSSFKPFIYSAALNAGMSTATLISNAPFVSVANPQLADLWRPENYEHETPGMVRLREGLVHSINIVSVRVLDKIGVGAAVDWAQRFGFTAQELPHNLTLTLGSASLTPLAMARGYAVFANGGFLVRPYYIQRIEGPGGNELAVAQPWVACAQCRGEAPVAPTVGAPVAASGTSAPETAPNPASTTQPGSAASAAHAVLLLGRRPRSVRLAPRTLSPQNAYLVTSMMQSVIQRGTGRAARVLGREDLAGKTGTTNDFSNAWFDGFSPRLVAVTWVGYDQPHSLGNGETGARAALPMWISFMGTALKGVPDVPWSMPSGLVTVRIDSKTGLRCGPDDPNAMWEVFRQDNVPPMTPSKQAPSLYGGGGG